MPTRIEFPEDYQYADALCGVFENVTTESGERFIVVNLDVEQATQLFNSVHAGAHEDVCDLTIHFVPC